MASRSGLPLMGSDVPSILNGFGPVQHSMEVIPTMNGMVAAAKVTFRYVADFQDAIKVSKRVYPFHHLNYANIKNVELPKQQDILPDPVGYDQLSS